MADRSTRGETLQSVRRQGRNDTFSPASPVRLAVTNEETIAEVLSTVRERIDPDEAERDRLADIEAELIGRAEAAIEELPVEASLQTVGSAARDTWLSGDHDVDLFVLFPESLGRDQLEEHGLTVGAAVLPDGREEYAEHPYVTGTVDGVDVDVVPCYAVDDATAIQSAVDRTPFHTDYVAEQLDESLAADVRLAKAFCRGIGVYGSDLRTRGFSGYLLELLVLEYGGFVALLQAAREWRPPVELDPEEHGTRKFDDDLVVIDPTDPKRNVAAVLSTTNRARFQHHARRFLAAPTPAPFETAVAASIDTRELQAHLDRRQTTPVAVRVELPALVDDQLYPQLRTSLAGIAGELDRRGFDVLRSTVAATERPPGAGDDDSRTGLLLVECAVAELPRVERHDGPPVHVGDHADAFFEKYADDPEVYGPFIEEDRYVAEREREYTSVREFLTGDGLLDCKHGTHVESALRDDGYEVLVGDAIADLLPAFETALAAYFDPRV